LLFSHIKALWDNAKKLGLTKKTNIKQTKLLIGVLKILPYFNKQTKVDNFLDLEEYLTEEGNLKLYKAFMNYFRKVWLNNQFIALEKLTKNDLLIRTNNG
jgi:hypothetical protein